MPKEYYKIVYCFVVCFQRYSVSFCCFNSKLIDELLMSKTRKALLLLYIIFIVGIYGYTCNYTFNNYSDYALISGKWNDTNEGIIVYSDVEGQSIWIGNVYPSSINWTSYRIEVRLKLLDNIRGASAGFSFYVNRVSAVNNRGQFLYYGIGSHYIIYGSINNGFRSIKREEYAFGYDTWVTLIAEVNGSNVTLWFNNEGNDTLYYQGLTPWNSGSIMLRTFITRAVYSDVNVYNVYPCVYVEYILETKIYGQYCFYI